MKSSKIIETRTSTIRMDEEGILRLKIKQGMKVDLKEAEEISKVIKGLAGEEKVLELMEGGNFFTFDEAAQKHAVKYGEEIFIASAIIIRSSGMRILFNFFTSFFTTPVPFKMFSSEEKALQWLRKFKRV